MTPKKRKKKRVRNRQWRPDTIDTFSREPVRTDTAGLDDANAAPVYNIAAEEANGLVVSPYGQLAYVNYEGVEYLSKVSESIGAATSLAPGDRVAITFQDGEAQVTGLAPRRTKLSRLANTRGGQYEQLIAVNVDRLIIVSAAAKPKFKRGMVDRYLITAQVGGVEPVLCVNKMDLVEHEPAEAPTYRELGVPVVLTSCADGRGLDELRTWFEGCSCVLAGASGVGKSSILNALNPELNLETQEVSGYNEKGKHTTTTARLYEFGGIRIIDTPGVRKLGLWDVTPEELAFYFPEMTEYAQACRFRDCTHMHEPGCAVLQAVDEGEIPKHRYGSYLRIRESIE